MCCGPTTTLLTPVEGLVLDFLGSSGAWWRWSSVPGFRFFVSSVSAILSPAVCEVFALVRALVRPVARLATCMTIALFGLILLSSWL